MSRPRRREIPNKNYDLHDYWSLRDLKLTAVTASIIAFSDVTRVVWGIDKCVGWEGW